MGFLKWWNNFLSRLSRNNLPGPPIRSRHVNPEVVGKRVKRKESGENSNES